MRCTINIKPVLQLPQLMNTQSQILIFWAILRCYSLAALLFSIYLLKKRGEAFSMLGHCGGTVINLLFNVQSLQNSFRVKAEVMRFIVHCKQKVIHTNRRPRHL
jgi:hypothetical protein